MADPDLGLGVGVLVFVSVALPAFLPPVISTFFTQNRPLTSTTGFFNVFTSY